MSETWPVATSPATGHPTPDDWRCPICWSPVDGNQCHLHRPLVWPEPIRDKALMEEP